MYMSLFILTQSKICTSAHSKKKGTAHLEVSPPFSRGAVALRSTRNLETMRFPARSGRAPTPQNRLRRMCAFSTSFRNSIWDGSGRLICRFAKIGRFLKYGRILAYCPRYFYVFFPFCQFLIYFNFSRGHDRIAMRGN